MSKKGENIFKRKDGRWEARYVKGHDSSGKIRYGYCYGKTYREAKEKVTQARAAALFIQVPLPAAVRCDFSFYCGEWLRMQHISIKESSYVKYDTILKCHILPRLGNCSPSDINTQLTEQFRAELLEEGLSAKTVRDVLMVLHAILKYTANQFPGTFPAVEIHYPRECKKETRILTVEEQKRFVTYLQTDMDECKFGILLALLTGLRIGELCALRWENISLESRIIHIKSTMQRLKNLDGDEGGKTKILIGDPKSDTSVRTIPMSDSAVWLCRNNCPDRQDAFVLTGSETYMEPRAVQRKLERYTRECQLENVHFHTLRHTFATRCIEVGFELKSLSEILGHSNTSITLNRYVHSSLEMKRDNMNKLASVGL